MTSTNFNIGLSGSEKNSSRVLRPPGGGHTDIFGVRDNKNEVITPHKKRNQPESTIGTCFNMVDEVKVPNPINNGTNGDIKSEKNNVAVENGIENQAPIETDVENRKEPKEPEQSNPASRRARVPPGGFSSSFW